MYGLVNDSFREHVMERHGEATWSRIATAAGVADTVFVTDEGYDDAITYALVEQASLILGEPAASILESFGVHWVLVTARRRYPHLMRASGTTLAEFLQHLPNLHARVELAFPHLKPPLFACTDVHADGLRLEYRSTREGLQPFVVGLLRGLAIHFGTQLEVEHVLRRDASRDHDVFELRWSAAGS